MVTVVPDGEAGQYPSVLTLTAYRRGFRQIDRAYPDLVQTLTELPAPFALFETLSVRPARWVIVVASRVILPAPGQEGALWRICGEGIPQMRRLFQARSIEPVAP